MKKIRVKLWLLFFIFAGIFFQWNGKAGAMEGEELPSKVMLSGAAVQKSVGVGETGTLNLKGTPITAGKVPVMEVWNLYGAAVAEVQSYIKMYGNQGQNPYSVYCLDYGKGANTGTVLTGRNLEGLEAEQKRLLSVCLSFGFHGQEEGLNAVQKAQYGATQAMVWNIMAGLFQTEAGDAAAERYLSYVEEKQTAIDFYYELKNRMLTYDKIPSYTAERAEEAPVYELTYHKERKRYEVIVEDQEKLTGNYTFESKHPVGLEVVNGNIIMYTNQAFAGEILLTGRRTDVILRDTVLYWNDKAETQRFGVSNLHTKAELSPFYVKLKIQNGALELQKIDSETKKPLSQITQKSWEGAVYDLFDAQYQEGDTKESASFLKELVIGKDGRVTAENLPVGTYFVKERKAPEGYLIDKVSHRIHIPKAGEQEEPMKGVVVSEEQPIRGDIELLKFGEDNPGEELEVKKPLAGVEFTLTSVTNGKKYTITTDESGYATTKKLGTAGGGLLYGTYLLEETKGPEGYKTIEPIHITIDKEGQILRYIIEDKRIQSAIRIVKVDAETKEVIPVSGTAFQILDETGKAVELHTYYPSYDKIDTFLTDQSGCVILPEPLGIGTYTLVETKAPKGYLLAEPIPFEVTEHYDFEEPLTLVCEDKAIRGNIKIHKTDNHTGENLAGVGFQIWQKEQLVETLITDENGVAVSGELPLGSYQVVENKPLPGYEALKEPIEVELMEDGKETPVITYELWVENKPVLPETLVPKTGDAAKVEVLILFLFLSCVTVALYAKIAVRDS